jgi:hypothetical protein
MVSFGLPPYPLLPHQTKFEESWWFNDERKKCPRRFKHTSLAAGIQTSRRTPGTARKTEDQQRLICGTAV